MQFHDDLDSVITSAVPSSRENQMVDSCTWQTMHPRLFSSDTSSTYSIDLLDCIGYLQGEVS